MSPNPHPLVLRAREALQRGDMRAVEAAAEERLKTAGRDVNALELRFIVQHRRGQFGQAARTLDTVIGIDPRADWAYNELIELFMNHGKAEDAEKVARAAIRANPRNAQAHNLFGTILLDRHALRPAEWHFRSALELSSPQAPVLTNLGIDLMHQGRLDEARPCFAQALEISPSDKKTLAYASTLEDERGNVERAAQLIDQAEAASSPADVSLLRANHLSRTGRDAEALTILQSSGELSGEALLTRGRIQDRLGNYAAAWNDFIAGKARLLKDSPGKEYRADAVDALFQRCVNFFNRQNVELLPRAKRRPDTAQPVFILGFPRSGAALLERILSGHPSMLAGGELPFVADMSRLAGHILPGPERYPENLAHTWMADLHYSATLFRDDYLARAEQYGLLRDPGGFFTDRMPFNEIYLPLIRMAFPEAKILRVIRHPLDVCISMLSNNIGAGTACGYRLEDIANHMGALFDLIDHYERVLGLSTCVVRYEALVRDPQTEVRRMLEHLNLPFDEGCLRFHERAHNCPTPLHAVTPGKLQDRSVGRHRHYSSQLAPAAGRLRKLMAAQDYTEA